jgi:hypothetical protein
VWPWFSAATPAPPGRPVCPEPSSDGSKVANALVGRVAGGGGKGSSGHACLWATGNPAATRRRRSLEDRFSGKDSSAARLESCRGRCRTRTASYPLIPIVRRGREARVIVGERARRPVVGVRPAGRCRWR